MKLRPQGLFHLVMELLLQWRTLPLRRLALLAFMLHISIEVAAEAEDKQRSLLQNNFQQLPRIHTIFSVECNNYFDWQTVGLMQSYRKSGQPGPITRLLSCTEAQLQEYRGMDLAPTHVVPSMSRHPVTGDWYPAINKPAGVRHWLENNADAKNVDWVVILDADMIIRHPIVPWELGAVKGKPVSAAYGYLIGCDNILAKLHTKHPEYCDKVGGIFAMHIDDLRAVAPLWLSKTEEVRADRKHWATNITGDIFGQGWISEMYGYSFGAAEVGLQHKISDDIMIYPGYTPREGVEPILLHYGLKFSVGNWYFSKSDHNDDAIVYDCNRLFPAPPYPKEVLAMEPDVNKCRGLFLSIECINTINEGLVFHHQSHGCSKPSKSKYINFLKIWRPTLQKYLNSAVANPVQENEEIEDSHRMGIVENREVDSQNILEQAGLQQDQSKEKGLPLLPKIHTVFSAECSTYFDWQTLGMVHSFELSGQPGYLTRLLSCTPEELKTYKGLDLAPTHLVPSYNVHPLTGDWYPAINKPAGVVHWINHVQIDAEFVVILDADMIMRGPITPWEFGAEKGHPVSAPYDYLIGCDNILARLHTRFPEACDKVGGVIIMHIDDLRVFAPLWLHKTEEVRADKAHYATNITGDIYGHGWISEMYGYSFGAAEMKLRHRKRDDIMLYPGYIPPEGMEPHLLHYGLEFRVGNWTFDKARWREEDMTNVCWKFFPEPPEPSTLTSTNTGELRRDLISIECVRTINDALYLLHKRRGCRESELQRILSIDGKTINSILSSDQGEVEVEEEQKEEEENTKIEVEEFDGTVTDTERKLSNGFSGDSEEFGMAVTNETKITRVTLEEKPSLKQKNDIFQKVPLLSNSPKYWMIALWTLLVLGFLVVVSSSYSKHRLNGNKQRHLRNKTRRFHTSTTDSNGEAFRSNDVDD